MGTTNAETTPRRLSVEDEKEIQRVVEYWKQSFLQLKTLDVELICTAQLDNGVDAKNRLVFQGRFVYDEPKYYVQVQFADRKGLLGDVVKEAFDGHYYWGQNRQGGHDYIVRSVDDPSSSLSSSMNPTLIQFGFVFDVHAKKTFASLKKPEIWESLKHRITRVDKRTSNDKSQTIFFVENKGNPNDSGLFHESYKVNVATGGIPFPSSWEMTTTQFPGMKTEFNVSNTKRYSQDMLQFSFPIRFNTLSHLKSTLMYNYVTNISETILKINQSVDPVIFHMEQNKGAEIIDGNLVE